MASLLRRDPPARAGQDRNVVETPADAGAVCAADSWARGRTVDARYDPADVFAGNHHLTPA